MRKLKRVAWILFLTALIVGVGLFARTKAQERRMRRAIQDRLLVISQQVHHWNVGDAENPLEITLFLRNKSEQEIRGILVFSVKQSRDGLEQEYLDKMIYRYGEDRLGRDLEEELQKGKKAPKFQAIYNYIARGRRLPPGEQYEPLPADVSLEDFSFRFREWVSVGPGEIDKVQHVQDIPPSKRGYPLKIAIDTIEF